MTKVIATLFALCVLTINTPVYSANRIFTFFSDSTAPCYKYCPFLGLYADLNLGRSWLSVGLHRPEAIALDPVSRDYFKSTSESFLAGLGYDFYTCHRIPMRVEIDYFYADETFRLEPTFITLNANTFAQDRYLVRNTMGTLYFDWHTCTRLVPYVGLNAGIANIKTYHHPVNIDAPMPTVYTWKENNFAWGGTIGTRFFFTNYLYANFQLRFDNLGQVLFKNFAADPAVLPRNVDYQTDFLHETTALIGLGYIF